MQDEILDLVNENDEIIGQESRLIIYQNKWSNFRVVNAFLVNSKGQLWIPKRTSTKKIFPNALDVSVGGHVESGETYLEAFKRELQEELHLELENTNYVEIGYLTPNIHKVSAFMKVYIIKTEITPDYNIDDFSESTWMYPKEVLEQIENGVYAKSDLIKLVKYYTEYIIS